MRSSLADAQHAIAKEYGCRSWAELMHVVETMLRGADQLAYVTYEMEALPKAANSGDLERVRAVLASGEFTQHDLDLALARSALRFDERGAIAQLLLEHGADPDGQYGSGYGPIVFVTGESLDVEGLQFLLDAGADVTFPPIDTKYGRQCPLSYWLGTYVRGRNEAKHRGIEILFQHGAYVPPEVTPPLLAIHRGDAGSLAKLLDADSESLTRHHAELPYVSIPGLTLLHYACEFGEEQVIDLLVARGADLNAPADDGTTPASLLAGSWCGAHHDVLRRVLTRYGQRVDLAVRFGQPPRTMREKVEIAARADRVGQWKNFYKNAADDMRVLDEAGSPPIDWSTVIQVLVREAKVEAVAELLDERPELLTSALWPPAIFHAKSIEMARLLLDRGLDPNECSAPRKPLHLAADRGLVEIVGLLLERGAATEVVDGENITPLDLVAMSRFPNGDQSLTLLRAAGARESIFTAIALGDEDRAIAMLDRDPLLVSTRGPIWFTPLDLASRFGRERVVSRLLGMGAPVDVANPAHNTALWLACQSGEDDTRRIAVARRLLDAGADPNRRCEHGSTPLHFAAWRGPVGMVELLLSRGGDASLRDDKGETPADYARGSNVSVQAEAIVAALERERL